MTAPAALMPPLEMVLQQAEDDGLWFIAQTAPEAYLQQELRKLHASVEQWFAMSRASDEARLRECEAVLRELIDALPANIPGKEEGPLLKRARTLLGAPERK